MNDDLAKKLEFLENNYRYKALFLILIRNEDFVTTDELAEKLHVTSRTIKSDVKYINEQLDIDGLDVVAQRSKGIRIEVEDTKIAKRIKEYFKIYHEQNIDNDFDRNVQFITRKLLASNKPIRIEDLQEELYLNTTNYIQREMTEVRNILKNYNLTLTTRIRKGLVVEGEVYYKYLCMLKMYKYFTDAAEPIFNNQAYAELFKPKFGSKQEIKDIVCNSLLKSRIVFSDIYLERFILYIILLSNVPVPKEDRIVEDIDFDYTITDEYRLVLSIDQQLSQKFVDYVGNHKARLMYLTYLAIMSTDLYRIRDCTEKNYGSLIALADEMRTYIVQCFEDTFNVCITDNIVFLKDLLKVLIPIAMKIKLGVSDDVDLGFYNYESMTTKPVIKEFVHQLSDMVYQKFSYLFSLREMHVLVNIIYEFINDIELSRKKQKIAIIALDGRLSTQQLKFCLRKYFSSYIESIETRVLYELSELDTSSYDLFFCMEFGKYLDIPYEPIYFFEEGISDDDYRKKLQEVFLSSYYYSLFLPKINYTKIPFFYKFQDYPINDYLNPHNSYMKLTVGDKKSIDIYIALKSTKESFEIHYYADDESPINGKQCYIIINLHIAYNKQKFKMLLNVVDKIAEDPEKFKRIYTENESNIEKILKK